MAGKKYEKHLTRNCIRDNKGIQIMGTRHLDSFGGGDFSIDCVYMTHPEVVVAKSHQHEFPQYLCFFSANPQDAKDFDAEIELTLGEERETHIINSPTIVYISPWLPHGPLNYVKVNKPVLFVDVALSGKYGRSKKK